ncbi:MAG: prolipoprotein diacylglyceryl transferase [Clostridia bacterium]|nr:prolipoprotein diacylglyceryl transferase [Clostridia bacterium]
MKKVLLCAAAVIGVLALLILVPTSPALLVDMPETIVTLPTGQVDEWGDPVGLPVTVYSVLIAAGAALAIVLTARLKTRRGGDFFSGMALALTSGVCALFCSHLLFCVLRWSYIMNDLGGTAAFLVQFWQGGYTMYGAILGALLGAVIYACVKKEPVLSQLDVIVPGIAVMIIFGRLGEKFTLQGVGSYVANEALYMLPFVSRTEWGTAQLSVYVYEALAALAALVCSLIVLLRNRPVGRAAETGLAIISLMQVMLDSWRGDELIRFGFVRLNMICAAVTLAVILGTRVYRVAKQKGFDGWSIARTVMLLAGAGVVIAIEFALDKSTINNTLLYALMTASLAVMGVAVLREDGR